MQVDKLQDQILTITPEAAKQIHLIGESKPQGAFRIKCEPNARTTEITFAWDDVYTQDDFMLPVPNTKHEVVMDALSIAYILDEYTLSWDGYRFIINKNSDGPLRHQNR